MLNISKNTNLDIANGIMQPLNSVLPFGPRGPVTNPIEPGIETTDGMANTFVTPCGDVYVHCDTCAENGGPQSAVIDGCSDEELPQ